MHTFKDGIILKTYSYEKYALLKSLSLKQKIDWSNEIISKALKQANNPAVSFSWGKDSLVLWDLIKKQNSNVKVIFANTGVEYPETYSFIKENKERLGLKENYYEVCGAKTFFQIVKEKGYPKPRQMACQGGYRTPACCNYLKEGPLKRKQKDLGIDLVFWGIQATESMNRRLLFLRMGEFYFQKTERVWRVAPLMIWNNSDVFEYCRLNKLALPKVYERMQRNGCMFCTAFRDWESVMQKYDFAVYSGFKRVKDDFEKKEVFKV